jgi:hypothetical protein
MSSAQLILVAVTSAMVAVFVMLLVATIKRSRARDDEPEVVTDRHDPPDEGSS